MKIEHTKQALAVAVLLIASCGGGEGDAPTSGAAVDEAQTEAPQTEAPQTDEALNAPVELGTAQYGYPVSRPLTISPPVDLADYYNPYWFDADAGEYRVSDESYAISEIRMHADAETTLGFVLGSLDEAIHQFASELYNSIDTGGRVSDNEIENNSAVAFHQQLNNCSELTFNGGYITGYNCATPPQFFYQAPGGGKLLVELIYKNANGFRLSIGNKEDQNPGLGYGVWYSFGTEGTRVFAQHTYPGAEVWTVTTIRDSQYTSEIRRDTYMLQNMEAAVRGLLFNEYD